MDTRQVVEKYMGHLCASEFAEAFSLFAQDGVYKITGKTAISGEYHGLDAIMSGLGGIISNYFKTMPQFTLHDILVDGDRAAVVAEGHAQGAHGPYDQNFVFFFKIKDGKIIHHTEQLDSLPVETALLGKKLVG